MTQHVSEKDVRAIAEYARIGLTDEELPAMTEDLNAIIESLKPITEYDLEGVEPTFHPVGDLSNVMREDVADNWGQSQSLLKNAPEAARGFIKVPAIIDESEDND